MKMQYLKCSMPKGSWMSCYIRSHFAVCKRLCMQAIMLLWLF